MKRLVIILTVLMASATAAVAQEKQKDNMLFNHLGIGVGVGTTGIDVNLATRCTPYLGLRAGFEFMPKVKYKTDVDIDADSPTITADEVEVEGKLNISNASVLLDIFPFPASSFHLTAGAYIGSDKIISVYNTSPFLDRSDWGTAGVKFGDYRIASDEQGNIKADIKVNKFKPYVGLGFGRSVPKKRVGVTFDMGVQFWGKPGVYYDTTDDFGHKYYAKVKKEDIDDDDASEVLDIMSKITVYPVIKLCITGRIF